MNTTSPYVFANKNDQWHFEELAKITKSTRLGGDCYSYCLLADGFVDIVIESGLKPWDIRALEPIIKNAGGLIKTWEGGKIYNGGSVIACANKKLFQESLIEKFYNFDNFIIIIFVPIIPVANIICRIIP
mgnify:CR=1 FL=1